MNYLAHLLLAGPEVEARVGALLGDFVKPRDTDAFGEIVAREIRVHRAVDAFTDSHPEVLAAKAAFRPETRRFAGIVLDVYFDHALSTHWAAFCAQPRREFIDEVYAGFAAHAGELPERFAKAVPWMITQDWLGSYASFAGVQVAVDRISHRLPKAAGRLRAGVEDVRRDPDTFERAFLAFFPQLVAHVEARRAAA